MYTKRNPQHETKPGKKLIHCIADVLYISKKYKKMVNCHFTYLKKKIENDKLSLKRNK